jgi:cytochrome c oxidase subunit 2
MDWPMHVLRRLFATFFTIAAVAALAAPAMAQVVQAPHNWQMGFQAAGSPVMAEVEALHRLVLWIITIITLFVAGLLGYVMWRYNAKRNPVPGRLSHHTGLEIAWTVIPVLILVVIAIPSFRLVYFEDRTHEADLTIKVTGHQWYWEYTYPDSDNLRFDSRYEGDPETHDLPPGKLRLLDVDNQLVLPAGKNVRILTTSADVIHSFFVPSLGVQRYAIPGRTIETWVRIDRPGVYYGECNQICGNNHSYMPISVRALPDAEYQAWVKDAKTKFAAGQPIPAPPSLGEPALAPEAAPARLAAAQVQH